MNTFYKSSLNIGEVKIFFEYQHDYFEPCNHILKHNVDFWYELSNNKVHIIDLFVYLCT